MAASEVIRRRNLPHWDVQSAAYFVTTCLEGSIPARGLVDLEGYRRELLRRPRPAEQSKRGRSIDLWKRAFARTDRWLDQEPAVRHLEDPRLARVVVDAFYYFAGQRYDLLAFVVMPSHYHWVFQPREEWIETLGTAITQRTARERIMQSINRYTSRECNRVLGRRGTFWQHEGYDHWVRDVEELERIMHYVEGNPVKAGLVGCSEGWSFSSAHDRHRNGLAFGVPLIRRA
jgi:type I restriction enzyme R subunit